MSENEPAVRSEVAAQIALQRARHSAFEQDEYELDSWEGFTCTACGWRGLNAPMDFDLEPSVIVCPECSEPHPNTSDENTRWHLVAQKLIESDVDMSEVHDG